jgi:ATP-dependent Lhr-like helicase
VEHSLRREREIIVSEGEAGSRKLWAGGGQELHKTVAEKMREVLCENTVYPYLSSRARARLAKTRKLAKKMGIGKNIFIPLAPQTFALFPWLGSRGMRTLLLILQNTGCREALNIFSITRENDISVNITSGLLIPQFKTALASILKKHTTPESLYPLIDLTKIPLTGKYDSYLPNHALVRQYAAAMLDANAISQALDSLFL